MHMAYLYSSSFSYILFSVSMLFKFLKEKDFESPSFISRYSKTSLCSSLSLSPSSFPSPGSVSLSLSSIFVLFFFYFIFGFC